MLLPLCKQTEQPSCSYTFKEHTDRLWCHGQSMTATTANHNLTSISCPPPTGFLLSLLQLRPAATPIDRDPAAPIPPLGHLFTTSAQHSTHKKESTTRWLCASPYGIGMYLSGERFLLISLEPCLSSRFLEQSEMQSIRDKKKSVGESDQIAASSRGAGGGSGGFN